MKYCRDVFIEGYGCVYPATVKWSFKTLFYLLVIAFAQFLKHGCIANEMKLILSFYIAIIFIVIFPCCYVMYICAKESCINTELWVRDNYVYIATPIRMDTRNKSSNKKELFKYRIQSVSDVWKTKRYINIKGEIYIKESEDWLLCSSKEIRIPIAFSNMNVLFICIKDIIKS